MLIFESFLTTFVLSGTIFWAVLSKKWNQVDDKSLEKFLNHQYYYNADLLCMQLP